MGRAYEVGLQEIGDGLYAYLQPDRGWSNAGLVSNGERSLLIDTLFDLELTSRRWRGGGGEAEVARRSHRRESRHTSRRDPELRDGRGASGWGLGRPGSGGSALGAPALWKSEP